MKKLLSTLAVTASILFITWCIFSTAEIASKNSNPNPQYSSLNLWAILFAEPEVKSEVDYYTANGRYYTNGTIITDDGNKWSYDAETISSLTPTDDMPIWVTFEDNGTPNDITDDIILELVYIKEAK